MTKEPTRLPLLTLRDIVLFPGTITSILIGREKSLKSFESMQKIGDGKHILITLQKQQNLEVPKPLELYNIGVLAKVIQAIHLPDNSIKILVEAVNKVELSSIQDDQIFTAEYQELLSKKIDDLKECRYHLDILIPAFKEYLTANKKSHPEILKNLESQKDPEYITNIIAAHLISGAQSKQKLLEETDAKECIRELIKIIALENSQLDTAQLVQKRVKKQIEKTQREFYLNEQIKALQKELDNGNDKSDFSVIEKKIKTLHLSKEAKEKAQEELKKLKMMNPMSSESSVTRNYLDTLLALPWRKVTKAPIDINKTQKQLDKDHYGLKQVKERIVEYLSVLSRAKKLKGPILCLIGPPGVGKTSLVKSIADAMGRRYVKFALGGVRDESEIRGHRRTYLGSMPGKIINLLKKAKVDNPMMLLDEIDKMGTDFRGDPASALLEVLDPEQNARFVDHYLEVEYDLSNIVFIATANSYNLPRALIDRMEVIDISGYVEEEKMKIAKNHLIPKQMDFHRIEKNELEFSDDAILELIRYYTKESGVRDLERQVGSIARKTLTKILKDKNVKSFSIDKEDLEAFLGPKKYRFGIAETENQIGSTTGLAYTQVGGDLLNIEAIASDGEGGIKSTGKLGDVMKESVQAAYSCFLVRAKSLGLSEKDYTKKHIHLHVPEGAIPKDGPSAGIAIYTTIVSLMTKTPVNKCVAMTGEITLLGRVLPIGGVKEKLLAASRGGITKVLIPSENIKDLKDIPPNILDKLEIIPVDNVEQVLKEALVKKH